MKNLFNAGYTDNKISLGLLLLRTGIGAMMLVHGLPKLESLLFSDNVAFSEVLGMNATISLSLAVFAEVICSALLIAGLGTRLATVPLIITMLVAVFHIHGNDPFAKQEMALHFLLAYLVLLVAGPGRYSADHLISSRLTVQRALAYS
ncbi:MAG TPA: DoxX family protein [Flavipsychrobacter sp.]|nr:DoxX family protein [Flavipsychrobacter sp.]